MPSTDENNWRDCAFVTPARAAAILGYSITTVRNLLVDEGLRAVRMAKGGPMFITVESLMELIDSAEPVSKGELARLARKTVNRPAQLTLIQGGLK